MKTLLKFLPLAIMLALLCLTPDVFAQEADTVDVAVLPPGNINDVIVGDTLAGGVRVNPNRVYRLERGRVYQVTQPLRINGSFKIIATEGDARPPVLAPAILPDNSSIDHFFDLVGKGANIELKNIYILSVRGDQATLGWSDGIRINADSIALTLRGVIFDAFTHRGISLSGQWSKLNVQDCHFRNHQHSTAYFGGSPFESDAPVHMDTCIFRNNSFFANNATNFSIRGYDKYSVFEHNTIAYGTVYPFLIRQASNLHIKNNLFYSIHSHGGIPEHVINGWFLNYPDTVSSGIFHIRTRDSVSAWVDAINNGNPITGPEVYVDEARGVTADMLTVANRTYEITNNAYFWPQGLKDFYTAYNDTVQSRDTVTSNSGTVAYLVRKLTFPKFITEYSQWAFDNLISPVANVNWTNNTEVDPGFVTDVANHSAALTDYVRKIATNTLDVTWHFNPSGTLYPPTWPLPENLRYTNAALLTAGSDGKPLGDLNWFPELVGVSRDNYNTAPIKYSLSEAYPNPFNPETNFKFSIANNEMVKISIYNILGQKVKTLFNEELTAGNYEARWDATDDLGVKVTTGVYFFKIDAGSFTMTKKMVLMK